VEQAFSGNRCQQLLLQKCDVVLVVFVANIVYGWGAPTKTSFSFALTRPGDVGGAIDTEGSGVDDQYQDLKARAGRGPRLSGADKFRSGADVRFGD
jgi:hypothetical protein